MNLIRLYNILILVILISSCAPPPHVNESPLLTKAFESPTLIPRTASISTAVLEEGKGGVQGKLSFKSLPWGERDVYVYACPFSGPSDEEGFYILEPSVHPNTTVSSDGAFRLVNLYPGAYVFVAGPTPEDAIAFQESGRARVFHIQADQVLDLGEINLELGNTH